MPPPTPPGPAPTARTLRFGFSPCPNDTFAFWAAVHRPHLHTDTHPIPSPFRLTPELADIEALNERAVADRDPFPVTKLSLPAFARVADRYAILSAGAALGFGCGPLIVCRDDSALHTLTDLAHARVAIPGPHTTANLLLAALCPTQPRERISLRFDQILPAVARGDCDAGLIIHESRFTYHRHGLRALGDLGELWERTTATPLPLGVIAARRDLPGSTIRDLTTLLRTSVTTARANPALPRPYIRAHSQELSDTVCDQHIALYVNDFTVDLGDRGRAAISELLVRGHAAGLLPPVPSPFHDAP